MSDALSTAISGLNDASLRVLNATVNIVNASSTTPDGKKYRPTSVTSSPDVAGGEVIGVRSEVQQRPEGSEVDMASEMVDIMIASVVYDANAAVIKAVDETHKKLIDTLA